MFIKLNVTLYHYHVKYLIVLKRLCKGTRHILVHSVCVRIAASNDVWAVCFRRDAGLAYGRHEIGQAVLAMFPRRERAQAVAEREAQARRRIQVRIRARRSHTPYRTLLDTCHVSFIIFQKL